MSKLVLSWFPFSLFLSSVLVTEEATAAEVEVAPMIVNGTDASILDFPSFVSLFIDSIDYDQRYSNTYCGGTLLDSWHVMTAAHCLASLNSYNEGAVLFTSVAVGLENTNNLVNAERHRIQAVFFHPDFENNITKLLPNDIAILRLETSTGSGSAVKRATKLEESVYQSSFANFVTIGHGDVQPGVAGTNILQRVDLFWISNAICADNFENYNLTPNQICFSGEEAKGLKAGTCQGDSGGPIYWVDNGDFKQVGITSFGPKPCGSIYSRVTAAYTEVADYESWISSVLSGELDDKPTAESSKEARDAYFASNGRVIFQGGTVSSEGSGGGGGGGIWAWSISLSLLGIAWLRRRRYT